MLSIEADLGSGEEIASRFVIAGSDGAELLQPGDEVFDQVARLVEFPVIRAGILAVAAEGMTKDLPTCSSA